MLLLEMKKTKKGTPTVGLKGDYTILRSQAFKPASKNGDKADVRQQHKHTVTKTEVALDPQSRLFKQLRLLDYPIEQRIGC